MLTSKQRSHLRSMASTMDPIAQCGKNGITENVIQGISDALEAHELIKINVLSNADDSAREVGEELAAAVKAECVSVIGRKVILYRRSSKKNFKHIEY